jgi:hypothetical protein
MAYNGGVHVRACWALDLVLGNSQVLLGAGFSFRLLVEEAEAENA